MSSIAIRDLAPSRELDAAARAEIRGGNSWLAGLGPVANVNVAIDQDIVQVQNIAVNALNNVGVIGAGFVLPSLAIAPSQFAFTSVAF